MDWSESRASWAREGWWEERSAMSLRIWLWCDSGEWRREWIRVLKIDETVLFGVEGFRISFIIEVKVCMEIGCMDSGVLFCRKKHKKRKFTEQHNVWCKIRTK